MRMRRRRARVFARGSLSVSSVQVLGVHGRLDELQVRLDRRAAHGTLQNHANAQSKKCKREKRMARP